MASGGASAEALLPPATVAVLAQCLRTATGGPVAAVTAAVEQVDGLALSERVRLVRDALLADLPAGYPAFAAVIRDCLVLPAFTGWLIWPVSEAVAARATGATGPAAGDAFEDGLALLATLTPRLTAEFALRQFLRADLERTLAVAAGWASAPDAHVRRLASEGTRPRLPWAVRVPAILADPACTVAILDRLYRDPSDFVRRSVANHLNDISRGDPAVATASAARWAAAPDANTPQVVRHALRSLIKAGDPLALGLLGFDEPTAIAIDGPTLDVGVVPMGGSLAFSGTVTNTGPSPTKVVVDYVVHHQKANATLTAKVFKLTTRTLAPGEVLALDRRHSFAPISTRRYHPGEHALELQVNGRRFGRQAFVLDVP
ncbi:DNA alkylation repair protein [Pseudonocardia sp. GCM10023141]|uniref:DNA alkylation repair protein n=1 Tax=Pseudonocardia sp. GCM10023141 TaxID=3252653 RepID=UPI00360E77E8